MILRVPSASSAVKKMLQLRKKIDFFKTPVLVLTAEDAEVTQRSAEDVLLSVLPAFCGLLKARSARRAFSVPAVVKP